MTTDTLRLTHTIGFPKSIAPPNHIQEHAGQIKAAITCCRQETEP